MFRNAEGGGSQGTNMLEGLVWLEERLASLDPSAHQPEVSRKLVSLPNEELQAAAVVCALVLRPAAGLAKINPMRWLRKRRLRALLVSMGLAQNDPAISSFHRAAGLELDLRPLRAQLEEYLTSLFGRTSDHNLAPGKLAEFSRDLHSILTGVHSHVTVMDRCPNRIELDRAAMTGTIEGLERFFERADRALRRHDVRNESRAALDLLGRYFDEAWLVSRRASIDGGRSNDAAIAEILEALPMLSNYQEFRLRSVRLGDKERAIFRALRLKELELSRVAPADLRFLHSCDRRSGGATGLEGVDGDCKSGRALRCGGGGESDISRRGRRADQGLQ